MQKTDNAPMLFFEEFENIYGVSAYLHKFKGYSSHGHNFYEIECIVSGQCDYTLNGKSFFVKAGDVLFVTPADTHSYTSIGSAMKVITVHIDSTSLISKGRLVPDVISDCPRLFEAVKTLYEEFRDPSPYRKALLKNIIERILLLYVKNRSLGNLEDIPKDITSAVEYIGKHYFEPITLSEVSKLCGYNSSYFCRKFKQYINYSFVSYLNHIRLVNAVNLLTGSPEKSVTEISSDCGFATIRHFNREFKKEFDCSPSEYRKNREEKIDGI